MSLHILFRKGVLGLALAGLVVSSAAAQAQDKDDAKDAAKAQKDAASDTRKCIKHVTKNAKQANKTYKLKICPLCVPPLPNR